MNIRTIAEAEQILKAYVPAVATYTGDDMSLVRMWPLLELVGNPHTSLRVVHVAGTSGKTSTCYYIAHYLQASAKKVGLTVSPHVDSITERVQIDGRPLNEDTFCSYLTKFLELIQDGGVTPSYFELLTVFELWVFVQEQVDYAVIETGMGGLFDASNVTTLADKVCVITDIGYDHMHILGDTLEQIATQKAGIIHANNVVFTYQQPAPVMVRIKHRIQEVHALSLKPVEVSEQNAALPLYQQRNWGLALATCEYVASRDGFTLNDDFDPAVVVVPGRMELLVQNDGSTVIMDGAHNEQKMTAFVRSFQKQFPNTRATVLLALKQGKEYKVVLDQLKPITARLIITTFSTSQDMPAISQNPNDILGYAKQLGIDASVQSDHKRAYSELLDSNGKVKIVTGSFYLLGQIRALGDSN